VNRRWLISGAFAWKSLGTLTVLMIFPCGILTSVNRRLPGLSGDSCSRDWGDYILGIYAFFYACVFLLFAYKLREVVDGFWLKPEMRLTGVLAIIVWIPWLIFNGPLVGPNNTVFPFSTLVLVIGGSICFIASTLWPLYRSLEPPVTDMDNVPEDISSLRGLLAHKSGVASFKKFLTKEFSVENILFYEEIEEYRVKKGRGVDDEELVSEAQRLYAKYIIVDSPFQVNLPDPIVRDLEGKLKDLFSKSGYEGAPIPPSPVRMNSIGGHHREVSESLLPHQRDVPTLFDKSQENIFKLMSTDSFPRYQRSEDYRVFVSEVEAKLKRARVLAEEGVTSDQGLHLSPFRVGGGTIGSTLDLNSDSKHGDR